MRNNYKSGTRDMTDEQVMAKVQMCHKYLNNKSAGVSNLTKAIYYENELKKRGYSEEQITDYCNEQDIKEYRESKIK